ncbi:hypothetical protein [Pseudomonas sp. PLMAX]|uniref:hypothetical protein n=1 Tax=Pseudomonas sp. PLMAX TaxID=2201998 RepID=UPI0038B856B3
MDHVIKRNGRHSSDILLFAMAAGDPVYPSRLEHPRDSGERYADAVRVLSDTTEKFIILLTLDATAPEYRRDLQEMARAALVDRVVAGVPLADYISVWVFAEEADYPVLFSDPAIAAVASTLERGIQAQNRQLGDPVAYVPSLGR